MVVMRWRKSSPYCDADKKYIRSKGKGSFSATLAVKRLFKITKTPVSAERINYTTESRLWTRNAKVSSRQHGCHALEKSHHETVIQIKKYIRKKGTGSFFLQQLPRGNSTTYALDQLANVAEDQSSTALTRQPWRQTVDCTCREATVQNKTHQPWRQIVDCTWTNLRMKLKTNRPLLKVKLAARKCQPLASDDMTLSCNSFTRSKSFINCHAPPHCAPVGCTT